MEHSDYSYPFNGSIDTRNASHYDLENDKETFYPDVDMLYGVYQAEGEKTALQVAFEALSAKNAQGINALVKGKTVGIIENGKVVEYWLEGDPSTPATTSEVSHLDFSSLFTYDVPTDVCKNMALEEDKEYTISQLIENSTSDVTLKIVKVVIDEAERYALQLVSDEEDTYYLKPDMLDYADTNEYATEATADNTVAVITETTTTGGEYVLADLVKKGGVSTTKYSLKSDATGTLLTVTDIIDKLFVANTYSKNPAAVNNSGSYALTNGSQSKEFGEYLTLPLTLTATASYSQNDNGSPTGTDGTIAVTFNYKIDGEVKTTTKSMKIARSGNTITGSVQLTSTDVGGADKLVMGDGNNTITGITIGTITQATITFASKQLSASGGVLKTGNGDIPVNADGVSSGETLAEKAFTTAFGTNAPSLSLNAIRYWFFGWGDNPTETVGVRKGSKVGTSSLTKRIEISDITSGATKLWIAVPSDYEMVSDTYTIPNAGYSTYTYAAGDFKLVKSSVNVYGANSLQGTSYDIYLWDNGTDISKGTHDLAIKQKTSTT